MISDLLLDLQWSVNHPSVELVDFKGGHMVHGSKYTAFFTVNCGVFESVSVYDSDDYLIQTDELDHIVLRDWFNQNISVRLLQLN